jgi:hypothetical protein
LETATITLENAQALLLLADKYDMRSITGERTPLSTVHSCCGTPLWMTSAQILIDKTW